MNKISKLLAVSALLFLGACEDSTEPSDPSSSSSDTSSQSTASVDACTLLAGAVCSETPIGDVPVAECTAQGGTHSTTPCAADELLKCEGLDVPGHDNVQSTAYFYDEGLVSSIVAVQGQAGLATECDAVPLVLAQ
jgi:hypothetical protein